jgi:urease accessory protein
VDLRTHLRARLLDTLARLELPLVREAYETDEVARLAELDLLADVLMPVHETRQASRSIGHSFLRAAAKLTAEGMAGPALAAGVQHQPITFGIVLHDWDVPLAEGLSVYAWQAVRQQLTAAQRLGRIGQSAVQQLLNELKGELSMCVARSLRTPLDEAGSFAPWLDLAGIKHEHQFARLFLS